MIPTLRKAKGLLFLLSLLALAAVALNAQNAPAPTSLKATGYVNDFAHVLSPTDASSLEQRATTLDQQLKVQVAFVTVQSTGGADAGEYSYQLAEHWGVGNKTAANGQDKDTGILIFIAVKDHHYFTQIGYGLEPYITDADAGSWMRALLPQLRSGDYGTVFSTMLDQIERTLNARMPGAAARLGTVPAAPRARRGNNGHGNSSPLPFFIFLAIIWIVGSLASRGRGGNMGGCFWPLLFMNMGGGGGYRGGGWGGGFGGGGGGFGGFGGGGFGGGGAGGSW